MKWCHNIRDITIWLNHLQHKSTHLCSIVVSSKSKISHKHPRVSWRFLVGGWTNPSEKYARQTGSFRQGSGLKIRKYLSCHHLDFYIAINNIHPSLQTGMWTKNIWMRLGNGNKSILYLSTSSTFGCSMHGSKLADITQAALAAKMAADYRFGSKIGDTKIVTPRIQGCPKKGINPIILLFLDEIETIFFRLDREGVWILRGLHCDYLVFLVEDWACTPVVKHGSPENHHRKITPWKKKVILNTIIFRF